MNISSRGLMIQTGRPVEQGCEVEVRRGDHVIVARVIWREGGRAGLQADDRVPIEEIMTFRSLRALQLTATALERRLNPRLEGHARLRGRSIEFAGILVIAISLASAALTIGKAAFGAPLARAVVALAH